MAARRVLVVDDDAKVRAMLSDLLRGQGYEVDAVGDGREALARFAEGRYTLAITDLLMADVNGLEVVRKLRDQAPAVPILLMTGSAIEVDVVEEVEHTAVLRKPFTSAELRATIARLMGEAAPGSAAP